MAQSRTSLQKTLLYRAYRQNCGHFWTCITIRGDALRRIRCRPLEITSTRGTSLDCNVKKANLVERPKDYQGPSWSWVAVNDGIRHSLLCDPFTGVYCCFKVFGSHIRLLAKGARFSIGDSGFGAVDSAELVVTGRLRKAKWVDPDSELLQYDVEGRETVLEVSVYPDAVEKDFMENINSIPVYLLKIIYKVFPEKEISDLVLREIGDGNSSRLGAFSLRYVFYLDDCGEEKYKRFQDWLDDFELQIISII